MFSNDTETKQILAPYEKRDDLNEDLLFAAAAGDMYDFEYCINNGADPHYVELDTGNNAAYYAASSNCINIYKHLSLLPNFSANKANIIGNTYLHAAAKHGHMEMVKYLVEECKFNPTIQNSNCKTAEALAKDKDYKDIADYLAARTKPAVEEAPVQENKHTDFAAREIERKKRCIMM